MNALPTLDAHAHLDPARPRQDFSACGAALAMTFSLEGAAQALERDDELIAWGVGCHPRMPAAQHSFDPDRFRELSARAAVVGEVGQDGTWRVGKKLQLSIFRQILGTVAEQPRPVSIHSVGATGLVLKELGRALIAAPILHRWTGTAAETQEAVELGCYFSIHSQTARHSKFRSWVPLERVLIESDQGLNDPPAGIPARIEWTEHLVAQQYQIDVRELRDIVWQNFARILGEAGTRGLPGGSARLIQQGLHDA
ncbi:MAG: TatD family hydrolase [Anaerolineales bacterium]